MSKQKKPWRRNYRRELAAVTQPGSLNPVVRPLRDRQLSELNSAAMCNRSPAWYGGVLSAATMAGQMYNSTSSHPYDLTDCILCKLNLISKRQLRRNPHMRSNEKGQR